MQVWDSEAQEFVEVEDPPAHLSLTHIWAETKLTQKRVHFLAGLKTQIIVHRYWLVGVSTIVMACVGALLGVPIHG